MRLFFHKLFHWEYWPQQIVYAPVFFQYMWYALRSRSMFFFSACNPGIRNGGFFMESKKEIYDSMPDGSYPRTEILNACASANIINQKLERSRIGFPFIAKPDMGQRGSAVKKIDTIEGLLKYSGRCEFNFLVQQLIPFKNEVGVFYVRFPDEKKGRITGIVSKEFMIVTGDGRSTLEQLMRRNPRYEMQIPKLRREFGKRLQEILPVGEKRNLVPYGNHIRGSKFVDHSHLISEKLTETIDNLCKEIPGFYFGRLDIMYDNWPDLENGKNFMVVEVNGASSEPTHIYDPGHSIFFGWKEIMRHVRYMYQISAINHKKGVPYLTHKSGVKEYRDYVEHNKKFEGF